MTLPSVMERDVSSASVGGQRDSLLIDCHLLFHSMAVSLVFFGAVYRATAIFGEADKLQPVDECLSIFH